ncbi:uncharacterized protein LOC144134410 [Amblyomma americanum]
MFFVMFVALVVSLLPVILFYEVFTSAILAVLAKYAVSFCGPLPSLATTCAHPGTGCSHLTSGQCWYSNDTLLTCSLGNRSLEDELMVEAYCLSPSIQAPRFKEASLNSWSSEAVAGLCLVVAALVLRLKFRIPDSITAALPIAGLVLLVDPRSIRDLLLFDVATMHAMDLLPFVNSSKFISTDAFIKRARVRECCQLSCKLTADAARGIIRLAMSLSLLCTMVSRIYFAVQPHPYGLQEALHLEQPLQQALYRRKG